MNKIDKDIELIISMGVTNTAEVIERLRKEGHSDNDIVPAVYQALLCGKVDPKGPKTPYRGN